ncbi:MAG: hypothetical protein A2X59_04445 [Nitrospirae bacterium GWC2_42_7]|nr:MAG: hypothetical protein A2X59_04445 [Nitrospirae bacterium GWC2_42_7]
MKKKKIQSLSDRQDVKGKETKPLTLEERVSRLERAMGFVDAPFDVEEYLKTPQAREELLDAIRRHKYYKDRKPLDKFLLKTGGRVPRREDD